MNENTKSFMIKDIPVEDWRKVKIKFLQDGYDTYNEDMLDYCKQDLNITHKLYDKLKEEG